MMDGAVLVTGAGGFIGSHLVEALRSRGETVLTHSLSDGDIARGELRFEGVAHVFHLAARTFVPDSWTDPRGFYEVNVLGTVNVLEFCRRERASITLLSSYAYGKPDVLPTPEEHPLRASNPYGHSKIVAEQIANYYRSAFGVPVTVVRPFNPYGPGQARHFLVPTLIAQALSPECEAITVADERPKRDYFFIDDLVDLLLRAGGKRGDSTVYNAGSGHATSVRELGERIAALAGTDKKVVSLHQVRPDEIPETAADTGRALADFGWRPAVDLDAGLARTIEFWKKCPRP